MDKSATNWMEIALNVARGIEEEQKGGVAYRRIAYALGAEAGLKPEQVDRALSMAKADIEDELKFKETRPGLYVGNTIQNLAAEPPETAAKKGKQYVEKLLDYADSR